MSFCLSPIQLEFPNESLILFPVTFLCFHLFLSLEVRNRTIIIIKHIRLIHSFYSSLPEVEARVVQMEWPRLRRNHRGLIPFLISFYSSLSKSSENHRSAHLDDRPDHHNKHHKSRVRTSNLLQSSRLEIYLLVKFSFNHSYLLLYCHVRLNHVRSPTSHFN